MSNQENVSRKAWLTGFVLNLCGNPLPIAGSEKEAAYLYNGVGLPEIDPVSMTLGWLIGCRIGAQRNTEVTPDEPVGDPVAYLYNGVRLPDINQVWTNKETYPYAYLIDYPSEWCLTLMSATLTFNGKQYVSGSA
ncbi:MAG: hypothetical protein IJA75_03265, partial [Oscillospiraceae bacterium]|nr:hypothetical protein [Oscillospiraceae bacterium]